MYLIDLNNNYFRTEVAIIFFTPNKLQKVLAIFVYRKESAINEGYPSSDATDLFYSGTGSLYKTVNLTVNP